MSNVRIEKHSVCDECFNVGISPHCVCFDSNYSTIELEFEVCDCCGQVLNDGRTPANTEFNAEQLKKLKQSKPLDLDEELD